MLVFENLYNYYARPSPEYCSVIFSPHYVYLINLIENLKKKINQKIVWTAKYVL